jgi:hypothetical protein
VKVAEEARSAADLADKGKLRPIAFMLIVEAAPRLVYDNLSEGKCFEGVTLVRTVGIGVGGSTTEIARRLLKCGEDYIDQAEAEGSGLED